MKRKGMAGNIFTGILLALTVAIVVARLAGVQFRAVISGSMEPEIPVGAMVVGVPTSFENIREGDDVIFKLSDGKTVVTHRVIAKDAEKKVVVTQGIANNTADGEIAADNILGVVRFHANYIGYPSIWLAESVMAKVIAGIVLGAAILIVLVIGTPGKDKRKARGEVEFVSDMDLALDDKFRVD